MDEETGRGQRQRECLQLGKGSRPHVEHTWKVLSENAASSFAASTSASTSASASAPASRTFPFPANWILMEMPLLKCPLAQFRGIAMRRLLHICPCYVSAAGAAWLPSRPHVCATSPPAAYSGDLLPAHQLRHQLGEALFVVWRQEPKPSAKFFI